MPGKSSSKSVSRRNFLSRTGGVLAAAPWPARNIAASSARMSPEALPPHATHSGEKREIPIGVFDTVYGHLSLDATLDKMTALGLEAVEIAVGGYVGTKHCPTKELLGNPVHPDPAHAQRDADSLKVAVLLAERTDVPVVVTFSGCPGGSPEDKMPNWVT